LNERFLSVLDESLVSFGVFEWFLIGFWIVQVLDEVSDELTFGVLFLQLWQLIIKHVDCFAHVSAQEVGWHLTTLLVVNGEVKDVHLLL
jgi:hypothetical protein